MKNFERINRRLSGEMTAAELAAFDKEVAANPELARELELQQAEESLLDFAVEEELLGQIKEVREEQLRGGGIEQGPIRQLTPWKKYLSIAAGIALLVSAFFLLRPGQNAIDTLALAQQNYQQYPPNFSGTKAIDNQTTTLDKYLTFLKSDDPEQLHQAIAFFGKPAADNAAHSYYLGHAYWKTQSYQEATQAFNDFLAQPSPTAQFIPSAEFYQFLSLLASGNQAEAKAFGNDIKSGHLFQKQLESILGQL